MPQWIIEPLSQFKGDRQLFSSGDEPLDRFFKQLATQYEKKRVGRTYIARAAEVQPALAAGYYTIANASISFEAVPINLPRHPIPTLLIARLATDQKFRKQGLGEFLLFDGLRRSLEISMQSGVFAVEVDAYESAVPFYMRYGFKPFLESLCHLYLPMKEIERFPFNLSAKPAS